MRLSNRTDNESAKMPTAKGVVQGYTEVAAVGEKHQLSRVPYCDVAAQDMIKNIQAERERHGGCLEIAPADLVIRQRQHSVPRIGTGSK